MKTEQFPDDFFEPPKSYYGDGPWVGEPDKLNWIDPDTGLDCMIVRNKMGNLCGYVGVPESHPWFGVDSSGCINKHEPNTFEQRKAQAQKWFDEATAAYKADPTDLPAQLLESARLALKPFLDPANYPTWVDMPRFDCLDYDKPDRERCKSPDSIINVHGGLTFADACHEGGHICHPKEGAAHEKVWWFGMDFAHSGDLCPGMDATLDNLDKKIYTSEHGQETTGSLHGGDTGRGGIDQPVEISQQIQDGTTGSTNPTDSSLDDGRENNSMAGRTMGNRMGEYKLQTKASEPQDSIWLEVDRKGSGEFVRIRPSLHENKEGTSIVGTAVSRHSSYPLEASNVRMGGAVLGDAPTDVVLKLPWTVDTYKGITYVTAEVQSLAKQLVAQFEYGPGCKLINGQVVCS